MYIMLNKHDTIQTLRVLNILYLGVRPTEMYTHTNANNSYNCFSFK
jgi:hypothetical protein